MRLAILLSTFNGELYLEQQINSILCQSFTEWELYIRDDGSTDRTIEIIEKYVALHKNKVSLITDNLGNLKSASSFMRLLTIVESDYFMFCDQDDIWLPYKIEKTLSKMQQIEQFHPDKSILIFTNLSIVDTNLVSIDKSMWHYSKINPENAKDFYKSISRSSVTGCTVMLNNLLKEKVLPYPAEALLHDWWICLNASHYGIVEYIDIPTVLYRQHGKNVLGVEVRGKNHYLNKTLNLIETIKGNYRVLKALKKLNFKVNYKKYILQKIKVVLQLKN